MQLSGLNWEVVNIGFPILPYSGYTSMTLNNSLEISSTS